MKQLIDKKLIKLLGWEERKKEDICIDKYIYTDKNENFYCEEDINLDLLESICLKKGWQWDKDIYGGIEIYFKNSSIAGRKNNVKESLYYALKNEYKLKERY